MKRKVGYGAEIEVEAAEYPTVDLKRLRLDDAEENQDVRMT